MEHHDVKEGERENEDASRELALIISYKWVAEGQHEINYIGKQR